MSDAITLETCRPVEEHARQIMEWRNDPTTLLMSFHRAPKLWDAFRSEYRDDYMVADPLPCFALEHGSRVGFLRWRPVAHPEGLNGPCVDISIMVAPQQRGRGFGARMLRAAHDELRRLGIDAVAAEIRDENHASHRAFLAAGYRLLGAGVHVVAETGERVAVRRYVCELVSPFWRSGRVRIIAEAGSNWRMGAPARDRAMGRALIEVAAQSGADVVKFQTYRPESVYVGNAGQADYLAEAGNTQSISEIFADLAMPYEMLIELADHARRHDIQFMSTGFSPADFRAIDPHVAIHKIASYENGHLRLIDLAAKSGKPVAMSTGATSRSDLAWAVSRYFDQGGRDLCLLQCTAKYPADIASVNLAALGWMRRVFGVPVGLSDHSRDPVTAPLGAVIAGARCIEKHFTLHNALPGPDHAFAVTPDELALMVGKVREAEAAIGERAKDVRPEEHELAHFARRGLQALRAIRKGDILAEDDNVGILRPGQQPLGAHPRHIEALEGAVATRDLRAGEGIRLGDWR
jgi:sialic acid synthase SpsE/RimJ/RimL family protein N-acetyltransferase